MLRAERQWRRLESSRCTHISPGTATGFRKRASQKLLSHTNCRKYDLTDGAPRGKCSENVRKMFGTGAAAPPTSPPQASHTSSEHFPNMFRTFPNISEHFRDLRGGGGGVSHPGVWGTDKFRTFSEHSPHIAEHFAGMQHRGGAEEGGHPQFRTFPTFSEHFRTFPKICGGGDL